MFELHEMGRIHTAYEYTGKNRCSRRDHGQVELVILSRSSRAANKSPREIQ